MSIDRYNEQQLTTVGEGDVPYPEGERQRRLQRVPATCRRKRETLGGEVKGAQSERATREQET